MTQEEFNKKMSAAIQSVAEKEEEEIKLNQFICFFCSLLAFCWHKANNEGLSDERLVHYVANSLRLELSCTDSDSSDKSDEQ